MKASCHLLCGGLIEPQRKKSHTHYQENPKWLVIVTTLPLTDSAKPQQSYLVITAKGKFPGAHNLRANEVERLLHLDFTQKYDGIRKN